jgi:6-pyruvoyltetrahydropterin/6-carboxytetrahydropterin synthase
MTSTSADLRDAPGETRGATAAIYRSTKTYDHNEGLSCAFRQWRAAHSHCRFIHGYALAFHLVFATRQLDSHNWCMDFGALKELRAWLHHMFDHTLLVAEDDPHLGDFRQMALDGLVDLRVAPAVGCEATAKLVFDHVAEMVEKQTDGRVWVESVEVREHGGNSASYAVPEAEPRRALRTPRKPPKPEGMRLGRKTAEHGLLKTR